MAFPRELRQAIPDLHAGPMLRTRRLANVVALMGS
jgi:hypothetical protein